MKHIFSLQEKKIFLEILKNYSRIVENKNTHSPALQAKNLAWQKITSEFNASPFASLHRTPKQLRRLWMNLKHRQKDIIANRVTHHLPAGATTNVIIDSNVLNIAQVAKAIMTNVDSSMDSDIVIETVGTEEPVQSDTCISNLYLSEDSQNVSNQDTPSFNAIKIEPISPSHTAFPAETVESMSITPPHIPNNKAHNTRHKEYSSNHENKSKELRCMEMQELEIQLLKEKIKGQQQENKSKEARAIAIHNLEYQLLKEKVREAKAKADLAELLLRRQQY